MENKRFGLVALKRISELFSKYYTGSRIIALFREATGYSDFTIDSTKGYLSMKD